MAISVEHLIKPLVHFWEISNEPWGAKDHTSKFIYANRKYHDLLALPKTYNVEGRLDGELPAATADFQIYFQLHDRKVEQLLDRVTSIEIHPFGNQPYLQPWYFDKYPLIDETGTCRGTIFHGRPVDTIALEKLKKIKTQTSLVFTPPSDFFSKREWEVVFYLLQGFTIKEISIRLFVSHRTVSNHVHRIYQKAGVKFKNELIDYFFQNNIANYVPENFFRTATSTTMGITN
ncbi:helix-turn-helix transcriptional regulator [Candidatus Symbiopectobacterium sp. NZEC135]|uniref:helix-turn-helix transcriptional regulator n=1 Tax=Candidatus Symbiopectobacterium sp. NZEC135 TaxID=2820471 RepID=UPI002226E9F0|nr:LuxR C-terminal-related transcriptional regulator [Candidatus Symbiopectobacterium sp. NZEC135]MCW2477834.1 PAS domain-containing protein [Candidatus Symbiopectobacterium sp. NZEC135]